MARVRGITQFYLPLTHVYPQVEWTIPTEVATGVRSQCKGSAV